jgi:hypothetical protein
MCEGYSASSRAESSRVWHDPQRHSGVSRQNPYVPAMDRSVERPDQANAKAAGGAESGTTDLRSLGIGLVSSHTEIAKAAEAMLRQRYQWADARDARTLVALGGDGFMLQTLHGMLEAGDAKPVFGMNRGTVGFLMNDWRLDRLAERMAAAKAIRVAPLQMRRRLGRPPTIYRREVPSCRCRRRCSR